MSKEQIKGKTKQNKPKLTVKEKLQKRKEKKEKRLARV